jgi:hypothetical protein
MGWALVKVEIEGEIWLRRKKAVINTDRTVISSHGMAVRCFRLLRVVHGWLLGLSSF